MFSRYVLYACLTCTLSFFTVVELTCKAVRLVKVHYHLTDFITAIVLVFTNLNNRNMIIDEMAYTGLQENHYPNPIPHPFLSQILNYLLECHRFHDIWTSFLGWNMVESCGINVESMNRDVVPVYGEYTPLAEQTGQLTCVENVTLNDNTWLMAVIVCRCFPQHHPLPMLPHEDACTAIDLSASSCAHKSPIMSAH